MTSHTGRARRPSCEIDSPISFDSLRVASAEAVDVLGEYAWLRLDTCFLPHQKSGFIFLEGVTLGGLWELALGVHREQDAKELNGLTYARMRGQRRDEHVESVSALNYDLDGFDYEELTRRRDQDGHFGISSTTFNHLKTTSRLASSKIGAWREAKGLPEDTALTDAEARRFIDEQDRGKQAHLSDVAVLDGGRTSSQDGKTFHYRIQHAPEQKCRTQLFLTEPIPLSVVGQDGYRRLYLALGERMFGTNAMGAPRIDTTCQNPGRIFWTPAHRPGAQPPPIRVHEGRLLDWRPLWEDLKPKVVVQRAVERKRSATNLAAAPADVAEIAHCLAAIPPSIGRGPWLSCLAAIFHETRGSEAGLRLAHRWSAGSPEQYSPEEVDGIWEWLAEPSERTRKARMGTLVWHARQHSPNFQLRRVPVRAHVTTTSDDEIETILLQAINRAAAP